MAKTVFIRIELVGNTDRGIYDQVHALMVDELGWERHVNARTSREFVAIDLPTAMYSGGHDGSPLALSEGIKSRLLPIWRNPLVLVMRTGDDWAISDGD